MKWLASISIDGAIQAPEEAKVSVYERGFLHGDSIFETVCTYGGGAVRAGRAPLSAR